MFSMVGRIWIRDGLYAARGLRTTGLSVHYFLSIELDFLAPPLNC